MVEAAAAAEAVVVPVGAEVLSGVSDAGAKLAGGTTAG